MTAAHVSAPTSSGIRRLWDRRLPHYPDTAPRSMYLAITVLATIVVYYQLYIQGAVATRIITEYRFSFTGFVFVSVIGYLVGAFAALFAGLADRWGRANLVVIGLLISGLLVAFGLPSAGSGTSYTVLFALLSFVEGVVLVVTPALIRDFSPQLGRASAMGFWTLGPVLGSLVVTLVSSSTLDTHPDWRFQFRLAGIAALAMFVITAVGLRELAPRLRDQLMVSIRDRALLEARAAGIDEKKALEGHWRQMLKADVLVSSFAISVFLFLYYILVGFLVLYFATVFGYSEARANSLGNWYWACTAVVLVATGLLSDRLRVRKPFMILGAVVAATGTILFALAATKPSTSYGSFVFYFILAGMGTGMAYVAWMASFTETVERHNPAATATGLAVWGWFQRLTVTLALAALTFAVPAMSVLADKGPRISEIVAKYPGQVQVLQTVDATTLAALQANPHDQAAQVSALSELSGVPKADVIKAVDLGAQSAGQIPAAEALQVQKAAARLQSVSQIPAADLAYLSANGADVAKANQDNPRQWQRWWWICVIGQLVFIPAVFLMAGRWNPRRARLDAEEHQRLVESELNALAPSDSNAL